ncbi:MAG: hypothetical protein GY850_36560, partial [bacterium]|nr:hypothetical protein [bacterium]
WIHPFLDGNGRVVRLFTDYYLTNTGMDGYGLWSISRGFARFRENYVPTPPKPLFVWRFLRQPPRIGCRT